MLPRRLKIYFPPSSNNNPCRVTCGKHAPLQPFNYNFIPGLLSRRGKWRQRRLCPSPRPATSSSSKQRGQDGGERGCAFARTILWETISSGSGLMMSSNGIMSRGPRSGRFPGLDGCILPAGRCYARPFRERVCLSDEEDLVLT